MSGPLVILVEFEIRPSAMESFLPRMVENARVSLATEPGCRRFDVLTAPAQPYGVTLYEIYEDADAFRAHCASEHFGRFDRDTASMIVSKRVVELGFACGFATDAAEPESTRPASGNALQRALAEESP